MASRDLDEDEQRAVADRGAARVRGFDAARYDAVFETALREGFPPGTDAVAALRAAYDACVSTTATDLAGTDEADSVALEPPAAGAAEDAAEAVLALLEPEVALRRGYDERAAEPAADWTPGRNSFTTSSDDGYVGDSYDAEFGGRSEVVGQDVSTAQNVET